MEILFIISGFSMIVWMITIEIRLRKLYEDHYGNTGKNTCNNCRDKDNDDSYDCKKCDDKFSNWHPAK